MRAALVVLLATLAGCPRPAPVRPPPPPPATGELPRPPGQTDTPKISWTRVALAADLPTEPPAPGTYRLHLIDVGTGLAILIQGADFALLYDAGTNDREEKPLRVVAYLAAVLGPSGPDDGLCVEPGAPPPTQRRRIDHVVLSHPHLDHASALDLVLHCYDVGTFWDSGRVATTKFYRELLAAIAGNPLTYRSAADAPQIPIKSWQPFHEGDRVPLGENAAFTILHADAKTTGDPNLSSIVLAVQLGRARVLLVGDAESGERKDPSYPPGDVEEYLLEHHADAIHAQILQVGHHGSITSSRHAFLAAVAPQLALVSSGPKLYGKRKLPDPEVLAELGTLGATVLRTDERDGACPVTGRIGGNDAGPGGCDTWVITIGP